MLKSIGNLHILYDWGKWRIKLVFLYFDIEKVKKTSNVNVLFGISTGWGFAVGRFTQKKSFYFALDLPRFNVNEVEYRSPIFFEIGKDTGR